MQYKLDLNVTYSQLNSSAGRRQVRQKRERVKALLLDHGFNPVYNMGNFDVETSDTTELVALCKKHRIKVIPRD